MFNPVDPRKSNQQSFMGAMHGLATSMAAALTLLVAPALHHMTKDMVERAIVYFYGQGSLAELVALAWLILVWPISFFALRATFVTALMAGALTAVRYGFV